MKPQIRWECPNTCAAVLGPRTPKNDNVCRYCLSCSATRGKLVKRSAPVLEKQRQERLAKVAAKRSAKLARKHDRAATDCTAYFTAHEVNLFDKMVEFTRLPVFKDEPTPGRQPVHANTPFLRVRRCSKKPRSRFGFCRYGQGGDKSIISVSVWPGQTLASLLETLLHEIVHAHVGYSPFRHQGHHGPRFKAILREACVQAFGVRPQLKTRLHGEITKLVDAVAATEVKP